MDNVQYLVNETASGILSAPDRLHPPEAWWARHQVYLAEKCGYMLRPRYHPDWIPSWFVTSKNPRKCEDSIPMPVMQAYHWMDAIQMSDGLPVMLKRVRVPPKQAQTKNKSESVKFNGNSAQDHSQGKRKHHKKDRSATLQTQSEINGNASTSISIKTGSNTDARASTNEEKAFHDEEDPEEVSILNLLSGKRYDLPTNYCSRLIDICDICDDDSGITTDIILVFQLLRPFNDPPFLTVGEGLDFIKQALDAVYFLHSLNIAHRDCGATSFMYDPSYLYPEGYHPVLTHMTRDLKRRAKHYSRTEFPPRYYITNFTYAKIYTRSDGILENPVIASDTSVPEFNGTQYPRPHDPFTTDVYLLGNMIKKEFLKGKHGFEFLGPFVEAMTHRDPARRPKIKQCVDRFFALCNHQPRTLLRKRFVSGPEAEGEKILNKVSHMFRNVKYSMMGIPPAHTFTRQYTYPYSSNTVRHDDNLESLVWEEKQRESTYRRSRSLSHSRPAEWKTEFARQQKMHRMQLEGRTQNSYEMAVALNQPGSRDDGNRSLLSGVGTNSSKHRILLNNQPGQHRRRTASDSAYYFGPRVASPDRMHPIPIPNSYISTENSIVVPPPVLPTPRTTRNGPITPSTFSGKRATPTYTPVPAQTYVLASPRPKADGRNHQTTQPRANTNESDNTDTTLSSITQTQETFVENNGNALSVNHEANADVSQLDLRLSVPDAGDPGTRTPRQERRRRLLEREQQLEMQASGETRAKESKSKPNSHAVKSNEAEPGSTSKSKSKSKSKSSKPDKRDTVHTRGTDEFNLVFPEPEALSPLLSPVSPLHDHERTMSPLLHSPVASDLPASLLTGPALAEREGSIHSIPDPEPFEMERYSASNEEQGVHERNGSRESGVEHENREERKHRHKHKSGRHRHRHSTDDSAPPPPPKKDRSTKWDCALCSRHLSSKVESIKHMQKEHDTYHICLHCGSYYTTIDHLERHQEKRGHSNNPSARKHKNNERYEFPGQGNGS